MEAILVPLTAVLVFFGSILLGLAIVCWTLLKLLGPRAGAATRDEETRMIQEIYQSLMRMEQRVEALETLLYETRPGNRS